MNNCNCCQWLKKKKYVHISLSGFVQGLKGSPIVCVFFFFSCGKELLNMFKEKYRQMSSNRLTNVCDLERTLARKQHLLPLKHWLVLPLGRKWALGQGCLCHGPHRSCGFLRRASMTANSQIGAITSYCKKRNKLMNKSVLISEASKIYSHILHYFKRGNRNEKGSQYCNLFKIEDNFQSGYFSKKHIICFGGPQKNGQRFLSCF